MISPLYCLDRVPRWPCRRQEFKEGKEQSLWVHEKELGVQDGQCGDIFSREYWRGESCTEIGLLGSATSLYRIHWILPNVCMWENCPKWGNNNLKQAEEIMPRIYTSLKMMCISNSLFIGIQWLFMECQIVYSGWYLGSGIKFTFTYGCFCAILTMLKWLPLCLSG